MLLGAKVTYMFS